MSSENAQRAVIDSPALPDVFRGPDTDAIPHPCHFDQQEQFDAFSQAWYEALDAETQTIPLSGSET